MTVTWAPGTVYLRITNKRGDKWVSSHQCWNRHIFIEAQDEAHRKEGGKIEVITVLEYEREKGVVHT